MKVAPETNEIDADAPSPRRHPRTEPILTLARAVLRQHLPPWVVALVLVVGILALAANKLIAPLLEAHLVTAIDLEVAIGELREVESQRQVADITDRASALSDLEQELLEQVNDKISKSQENCPHDLALLLRWMATTKVINGESLPPDLKLCMLLQERAEKREKP